MHHGAPLVCTEGQCGQVDKFTCPYHGWEYQLNGRLSKATSLKGIKNFKAKENGLKEIPVTEWGPMVFINFDASASIRQFHAVNKAPLEANVALNGFS